MEAESERNGGFVGDTLVMVDNRRQSEIEQIYQGESVAGRCEQTAVNACSHVVKRLEGIDETCYISFVQDAGARAFPMESTLNQEFRVAGRGWVKAMDIRAGDIVETHDGNNIVIQNVVPSMDVAVVFRLELDGLDTCFVGNRGLWARAECLRQD